MSNHLARSQSVNTEINHQDEHLMVLNAALYQHVLTGSTKKVVMKIQLFNLLFELTKLLTLKLQIRTFFFYILFCLNFLKFGSL